MWMWIWMEWWIANEDVQAVKVETLPLGKHE